MDLKANSEARCADIAETISMRLSGMDEELEELHMTLEALLKQEDDPDEQDKYSRLLSRVEDIAAGIGDTIINCDIVSENLAYGVDMKEGFSL